MEKNYIHGYCQYNSTSFLNIFHYILEQKYRKKIINSNKAAMVWK